MRLLHRHDAQQPRGSTAVAQMAAEGRARLGCGPHAATLNERLNDAHWQQQPRRSRAGSLHAQRTDCRATKCNSDGNNTRAADVQTAARPRPRSAVCGACLARGHAQAPFCDTNGSSTCVALA